MKINFLVKVHSTDSL